MTDKETIINKVNVNRCSVYKNGLCLISKEKCNAKCDYAAYYLYEQLERKEQECEKYEQALDEIKSICLKDVHTFADGTQLRYDSLDEILTIINKAKDGNNE